MKAEIDANGTLTITPETPTEAYALRRRSEEGDSGGVLFPNFRAPLPPRAENSACRHMAALQHHQLLDATRHTGPGARWIINRLGPVA